MADADHRLYQWATIGHIPEASGVYAWYYLVDITDRDIQVAIDRLRVSVDAGDDAEARASVVAFFQRFVFRFFEEEPYVASIRGALKPHYRGELPHRPSELSSQFVDRIVDDPERLWTLQKVLRQSVPLFASPIYIGMSQNLRKRVGAHVKLVEQQREGGGVRGNDPDSNFARRVVEREMAPSRLRVAITVIESDIAEYLDAENILNRINYPILGRN